MAYTAWKGGATAVAQVSTITLNNDTDDAETDLTVTLTAENGSTQQESITPSGTDETVIAAALQAELAASTQTLFAAVTWTQATNVVTGTAKTAGVPFYFSSAYTGGTGTTTDATGTASAGPNDWNTTGNWTGGAVPSSGDDVTITWNLTDEKAYSILYGLDQSSVDLKSLAVDRSFKRASIGQVSNGYYLQIDVANTGSSNVPKVHIEATGSGVWLDGTMTTVHVVESARTNNAVNLAGDIDDLYVYGADVLGWINVKASTTIDNVHVFDANGSTVKLHDSLSSFDTIEANSGRIENETALTTATVMGSAQLIHYSGAVANYYVYGGKVIHLGGNITGALEIRGGEFEMGNTSGSEITVTPTIKVYSGSYKELPSINKNNIAYNANPIQRFGGTVQTTVGTVVDPSK